MEVVQSTAEVKYTLTVGQFSCYRELGDTFTTDFVLSVNGVRTSWQATLTLFHKENVCASQDPMNSNIGISLECVKCNINHPGIEVYCSVKGRDQHEKRLARSGDGGWKWQGILVSRVTLDVFKLLIDDVLTAHLRFVVSEHDMAKTLDSREHLIRHLGKLQKTGVYSDIEILTSDGIRLPAHCAILNARSNLLQKVQSRRESHESENVSTTPLAGTRTPSAKPSLTRAETPLNSTFEGVSSICCSVTSLSPDSSSSNCGKLQLSSASSILAKGRSLPPISGSPVRCLFSSSRTTPSKLGMTSHNKYRLNNSTVSPSKLQTPATTFPRKRLVSPSQRLLSPTKRSLSPTKRSLSPSKRLVTSSKHLSTPSPSFAEIPSRRMLRTPEKNDGELPDTFHTEPLPSDGGICFPTGESRTPLKQLENQCLKSPIKQVFVKVNMSSSVTEQLLEWIYIGKQNSYMFM
nr:uncharacterized protein LOC123760572 [Procambarus clarkii]